MHLIVETSTEAHKYHLHCLNFLVNIEVCRHGKTLIGNNVIEQFRSRVLLLRLCRRAKWSIYVPVGKVLTFVYCYLFEFC